MNAELPNTRPLINVASALLINADRRVLLAQRPDGKRYAGWWELPGGKLEAGELPAQALTREIEEELGMLVAPDDWQPVTFVAHDYPDLPAKALVLIHAATRWQGQPESRENQAFAWVTPESLASFQLLPTMQSTLPALMSYLQSL